MPAACPRRRRRWCARTPRQTALVTAVLAGDRGTLESLFLTDPLVAALSPQRGGELFREMVEATNHRLPAALRF